MARPSQQLLKYPATTSGSRAENQYLPSRRINTRLHFFQNALNGSHFSLLLHFLSFPCCPILQAKFILVRSLSTSHFYNASLPYILQGFRSAIRNGESSKSCQPPYTPMLTAPQHPPSQTAKPTTDNNAIPFSSALPYEVSTPATTTSSILLRRLTALGTAAALLSLIHPLPYFTSIFPRYPPQPSISPYQRVPYLFILLQTLDTLLSTSLIVVTLFSSYNLALYEGSISINNKVIELKWLIPVTTAAVALAAAAEETWIKTNLLWDLVLVLVICGWKVMSKEQRGLMGNWVAGVGVGRLGYEIWRGEGWKDVRGAVECLIVGLGEDC